MEMRTVLRAVVERIDLAATAAGPERPVRHRRFAVTPSRGGRIAVVRRRDGADRG
jgi:cytochrome P450